MKTAVRSRYWIGAIALVVLGAYYLWQRGTLDPFPARIPADAFKLISKYEAGGQNAIVFVHGLDGDPLTTFQANEQSPSWFELLKNDRQAFPGSAPPPPLSAYSIYALDYRRLYASDNTIESAAQQIADYLRSQDLFKKYNHVSFITHSLGGILIKRTLLIYEGQGNSRLLNRVAGVFLLGVPSQGAPLANLTDKDVVELLTAVVGRRYRVVKDLRPDQAESFLNGLENSWGDFIRRRQASGAETPPYVYCAYERDATFRFAQVVPRLYAQTLCAENPAPISTNHIDLVKPTSTSDQVYTWVRDRIGRGSERIRRWSLVRIAPGLATLGEIIKQQSGSARPAAR